MNLAQQQIDQAGTFRAFPISWTLEKSESSQSVAIAVQYGIFQRWDEAADGSGAWSQEWPQGYFVYGRHYVVKKDGNLNDSAVDALGKAQLWDGDWEKIGGPPPQVFVLVQVDAEEYQGKVRHRVNWVHPNGDAPPARGGGFKPADPSLLQSMRARYQAQTRAVAGGQRPGGTPPAPPRAQPAVAAPAGGQGIPPANAAGGPPRPPVAVTRPPVAQPAIAVPLTPPPPSAAPFPYATPAGGGEAVDGPMTDEQTPF